MHLYDAALTYLISILKEADHGPPDGFDKGGDMVCTICHVEHTDDTLLKSVLPKPVFPFWESADLLPARGSVISLSVIYYLW